MLGDNIDLQAYPIRIIPFDLGRNLDEEDESVIGQYASNHFRIKELSPRQTSILKDCFSMFCIDDHVSAYLYKNGMMVVVVDEPPIDLHKNYECFSITYGENRKRAHNLFFHWEHPDSLIIANAVSAFREVVRASTHSKAIRASASENFENKGLSYIMTLSMFDVPSTILKTSGFKNYPDWLKSNIYALLDPSVLYLEDSSKFRSADETEFDVSQILKEVELDEIPRDLERHRHVNTYMSWAAVVVAGQIQDTDKEEYTALEVQLQSDWFYVYCLEKSIQSDGKLTKREVISYQRQSYELDLLENRLFDFDDSSMPTRILDIQKGLVETSGLDDNIQHTQRKIRYILEREQLNTELRQKRLGQSSEILLFIIAFIEIAPTVAEYGNRVIPYAGILANCLIVFLGLILLLRKG